MIHEDAMIVRLSISRWTARKFDKAATTTAITAYAAGADAGRFNKVLIAKTALKGIDHAVTAARSFHYEQTLPWDDAGGRLLPAKNFMTYSKKMRVLRETFDTAVGEFIENYPQYREDAREVLRGMFNPDDYPGVHEVKRKFDFGTDIEPIPHSDDFRVKLQKKDQMRVERAIEDRVKARVRVATDDLFHRLSTVTKKFVDVLSTKDAIFRDSLVGNVVALVELLPRLNVENNQELENLRKAIKRKIASHDPDSLRKQPKVRAAAVEDARAILDKMSGYLGGSS